MLTFLKQFFVWWNHQTFGTRIKTLLHGRFVGTDNFGNKYYQSKLDKRWVIYNGEIDASKIPNEWYLWMHHLNNSKNNFNSTNKYIWQKPHLSNQTGTKNAYHPQKNNNEIYKKYKSWKD
jgi:NADH:ubiquinone oxidoreductase subunit